MALAELTAFLFVFMPPNGPTVDLSPDSLPRTPAKVPVVAQIEPAPVAGTSQWAAVIDCESGGDPMAWNPAGPYWGLYQFDAQTWYAHGGPPGSYGSAGPEVQHQVASRVTYDAWPNC